MDPEVEDVPGGASEPRAVWLIAQPRTWEAPGFPCPEQSLCAEPGLSKKLNPPPPRRRAPAWQEPAEKGPAHFPSCALSQRGQSWANCVFKDWGIINSLFIVDIRHSLGVQSSRRRGYRRAWSPWLSPRCSAWMTATSTGGPASPSPSSSTARSNAWPWRHWPPAAPTPSMRS